MNYLDTQGDRRQHMRFPLGLPVNVHVIGRPDPVNVETIDIGAKGVRFRINESRVGESRVGAGRVGAGGVGGSRIGGSRVTLRLEQQAAFGFVVPGQRVCVASGTVMRVVDDREFVMSIERANDAFRGFLISLAH